MKVEENVRSSEAPPLVDVSELHVTEEEDAANDNSKRIKERRDEIARGT